MPIERAEDENGRLICLIDAEQVLITDEGHEDAALFRFDYEEDVRARWAARCNRRMEGKTGPAKAPSRPAGRL